MYVEIVRIILQVHRTVSNDAAFHLHLEIKDRAVPPNDPKRSLNVTPVKAGYPALRSGQRGTSQLRASSAGFRPNAGFPSREEENPDNSGLAGVCTIVSKPRRSPLAP
jgi:hypothetical protein